MQDGRTKELDRLNRITTRPGRNPQPRTPSDAAWRFLRYGEPTFRRLFRHETGLDIMTGARDDVLARCVFFHGRAQREAWEGSIDWYYANAVLFLRFAPVAAGLTPADLDPADTPHYLMIRDALHLLQRCNRHLGRADADYGAVEDGLVPFSRLFQRSRRVLSSCSADVNIGAATIGLAIESRLKSALGAYEIRSRNDDRFSFPVPMSQIFKALAQHRDRIRCAVDLDTLILIYNWANNYRHVGLRAYAWMNYFANDLLAPLFAGDTAEGGGDHGLQMDRQTLVDVQTSIRSMAEPRHPQALVGGRDLERALSL